MVGKIFRNEAIDWKHLAEFHQVEGIVVGNVTMRDLTRDAQPFYARLGFRDRAELPPRAYTSTAMTLERA